MGFKKVFALKGGWPEWSNAGYPVEPKDAEACFIGRRAGTGSYAQQEAFPG